MVGDIGPAGNPRTPRAAARSAGGGRACRPARRSAARARGAGPAGRGAGLSRATRQQPLADRPACLWQWDALRDHLLGQSRPDPRPRADLSGPSVQASEILSKARAGSLDRVGSGLRDLAILLPRSAAGANRAD